MTLGPTLEGGLKIIPEEEVEWQVLLAIAVDADDQLASRYSDLMDEDSMWEDIVVPDLAAEFQGQRERVRQAVREAKESEEGELLLRRGDADLWYGAINQARLSLESRYQLSAVFDGDEGSLPSGEVRSAYFRNEFYGSLQLLIMKYMMEDLG